MKILGIETSCDETAAAVVQDGTKILSQAIASSLPIHAKTGGVIPEIAAREQLKTIARVIGSALEQSGVVKNCGGRLPDLDAIAVTYGPGLIGSLLVGVQAARALSYVWNKPIIAVNHLIGHLYSTWLDNSKPPRFPLIALIVSGGHTELLLVKDHGGWAHLGGTRDDAAGEAFDKTARLLNLGYPGGPAIEKAAAGGDPSKFDLPRPMIEDPSDDFSFSGLKTAVVNLTNTIAQTKKLETSDMLKSHQKLLTSKQVADLAASIQEAIVAVLVKKTIRAANNFKLPTIVLGGGVAANRQLREKMAAGFGGEVKFAAPTYSIDNGAMIASAAFFNPKKTPWQKLKVDASILF